MTQIISLNSGWQVLQDVHALGVKLKIYDPGWVDTDIFTLLSEWEDLPMLTHLQLVYSKTPYFGRELRYFNHGPWWYKIVFTAPADAQDIATLRFEGVDYYCDAWLNGEYLGAHEGYSSPFSFDTGAHIRKGSTNTLVVRVHSPWDTEVLPGEEWRRLHRRVCTMMKGTYEHADTFIQRDVNPVGIWGDVSLIFHDSVYMDKDVKVNAHPNDSLTEADIKLSYTVRCATAIEAINVKYKLCEADTGKPVKEFTQSYILSNGDNELAATATLVNPRIWHPWERGTPHLYKLELDIQADGGSLLRKSAVFGVRSVVLERSADSTIFFVNGKRFYFRASSYLPDVYVSRMSRERYMRDVRAAKAAGINALRVHVHVCQQSFYDVCDELGMLVFQDSDFNWCTPDDDVWAKRAVGVFTDMVNDLYNHPSVACWIVLNEPQNTPQRDFMDKGPGPQLVAALKNLDPHRPYIKGSDRHDDPESGDIHDYTGCFDAETYLKYDVSSQKLNTEFGMDAPPVKEHLRTIPKLHARLKNIENDIPALQYYQYRLHKHVFEEFRLNRYSPNSGYFQFMFIDLCPQSFYGVYDWWGVPKEGLRAFEETNMPIAIIMRPEGYSGAKLWVVNDLLTAYEDAVLRYTVTNAEGDLVAEGEKKLDIPADGLVDAGQIEIQWNPDCIYNTYLTLTSNDGEVIAFNRYHDPLHVPPHPAGHYHRMSHELGVRLYHA